MVDGLQGRLTETWGTLSTTRRALLALTGGALVALAVLLYSWSSSTQYVTLYSGLDPQDSGQIVDRLRSRGTPFEVEGGGSIIRVPEADVDEVRVDLAVEGLPEGGNVGFELFEGNAFTATDFVQRLNFQRGLQGELARTIESFDAVDSARVHIVMPERSLFRDDDRPTTASVVLDLRPGMNLSSSEVAGIAHLVGGAVEGLEREGITIIDTSGAMLYDGSEASEDGGIGVAVGRLEMQRGYEQTLQRDAQTLLDRSLGPGRGVVTVRVDMDFDTLETEREVFDPGEEDDGVPRSATTVEETYRTEGADVSVGAVPGAVANVPGADGNLPAAGSTTTTPNTTDYSRTETTTNFEVGRTVTRAMEAPGDIERVSLSLLLDEEVPEAQVAPLQGAVAAAVGIDEARGDTVAVTRFAFDRTAVEEAEAAFASASSTDQILGYVRIALPIVVLIVAFIFFRLLMRSVSRHGVYSVREVAMQPALPAGGAAAVEHSAATARLAAASAARPPLRGRGPRIRPRFGAAGARGRRRAGVDPRGLAVRANG